jgi:preprotein translocase subunit SecD
MEIVPGVSSSGAKELYLLRKSAAITGADLKSAKPSIDEYNLPAVRFILKSEGVTKFTRVTESNIGRQLAIVLDGKVQSAPRIDSRITSDGRISGSFTNEEVQNLSLILRSGSLPATLTG